MHGILLLGFLMIGFVVMACGVTGWMMAGVLSDTIFNEKSEIDFHKRMALIGFMIMVLTVLIDWAIGGFPWA
jgi:hypothetical protein